MPWYDLPEEQLKDYRTGTPEPADLDVAIGTCWPQTGGRWPQTGGRWPQTGQSAG